MRIEELYDSLFDAQQFEALPGKLATLVDGRSSIAGWIYTNGSQRFLGTNGYFADHHIAQYLAEYAAEDPWTLAAIANFQPEVMLDMVDYVSDAEYERSRLWNEFFRSIGDDTWRALAISAESSDGMGSIAVHRGKSGRPFGEAGMNALRALAPHVARVLALRARFDAMTVDAANLRAIADQGPVAAITVDVRRRILATNAGGEALLAEGSALANQQGRLVATGPAARAIEHALEQAITAMPIASTIALPRSHHLPRSLDIVPMPINETLRGAMLVVRDPAAMAPDVRERLSKVFGMTRAEAAIAASLAEGMTIDMIAAARNVSRETVRVQLRDVGAKLGCTRQAEIAATVRAMGALASQPAENGSA